MYVMIDNYDSFVYNLAIYFQEIDRDVEVIRNDEIEMSYLDALDERGELEGIIISPGPKGPWDCGRSADIVRRYTGKVPILGVCLGHQIIGYVFGAKVEKGIRPMHGKVTGIRTRRRNLFENLPGRFKVTRYHSLVVTSDSVPEELQVDAETEDGVVMAVSHRTEPVYGVQFHPEAVLTEYGHEILQNFCEICEKYQKEKGSRIA
ncbi:MAG: aminodeoxychorismate/anthranilate synthase component II [Lachnospiraceae bacterium]|nr:aminodeoxychorismate/anthranilate synthase component II [Lachnospiraceae bacterium]